MQDNALQTYSLNQSPMGISNDVYTYSLNYRHIVLQDDLKSTIRYWSKTNHFCHQFHAFVRHYLAWQISLTLVR